MQQDAQHSTHTPGPWGQQTHTAGVGGHTKIEVFSNTHRIAIACRNQTENPALKHTEIPLIEAEANARLIAAAPELLAACRRALEYAPNEIEADVLRLAIAKATGA